MRHAAEPFPRTPTENRERNTRMTIFYLSKQHGLFTQRMLTDGQLHRIWPRMCNSERQGVKEGALNQWSVLFCAPSRTEEAHSGCDAVWRCSGACDTRPDLSSLLEALQLLQQLLHTGHRVPNVRQRSQCLHQAIQWHFHLEHTQTQVSLRANRLIFASGGLGKYRSENNPKQMWQLSLKVENSRFQSGLIEESKPDLEVPLGSLAQSGAAASIAPV